MKWKTPLKIPPPRHLDERQRRTFALWPRKCSDGLTRWLEDVIVHERFTFSCGDYDSDRWIEYEVDPIPEVPERRTR